MVSRAVFVNPPRSDLDTMGVAPPLGLLSLAAIARQFGMEAEVVDFNLDWHRAPETREPFFNRAVERLVAAEAEIYGFTSTAVDTHVALELSRRLKDALSSCRVIVGGPHFSAIADRVISMCPWIDHVVVGEGEACFSQLAQGVASGSGDLPARRTILRSAPGDIVDRPPQGRFEGVNIHQYLTTNQVGTIDLEAGRACRYRCAFCYSPSFYQGARYFNSSTVLRELYEVRSQGASHVFFVDDNFLNHLPSALRLCKELEAADLNLTWGCYATLPQLRSGRILRAMAAAGCTEVFLGIDAVRHASGQLLIKKFAVVTPGLPSWLDTVSQVVAEGIHPTCAFLLAPPSHPMGSDFDGTIRGALEASACGADVRLNVLSYYPGTALQCPATEYDTYRLNLLLDVPKPIENNPYAQQEPTLFPFHSRYVPEAEWKEFVSVLHVLFTLVCTRNELLRDVMATLGMDARGVGVAILTELGDLATIPKKERRLLEVSAFDALYGAGNNEEAINVQRKQDAIAA